MLEWADYDQNRKVVRNSSDLWLHLPALADAMDYNIIINIAKRVLTNTMNTETASPYLANNVKHIVSLLEAIVTPRCDTCHF